MGRAGFQSLAGGVRILYHLRSFMKYVHLGLFGSVELNIPEYSWPLPFVQDAVHLARIAELEQEIEQLKKELNVTES